MNEHVRILSTVRFDRNPVETLIDCVRSVRIETNRTDSNRFVKVWVDSIRNEANIRLKHVESK